MKEKVEKLYKVLKETKDESLKKALEYKISLLEGKKTVLK